MSILSDLLHNKITWNLAAKEIESWFVHEVSGNSPVMESIKQTASVALGVAGTEFGTLLAAGTPVIEGAVNAAVTAALGPVAPALTPAIDNALTTIEATLSGAVTAEIARIRSTLAVTMAPVANP